MRRRLSETEFLKHTVEVGCDLYVPDSDAFAWYWLTFEEGFVDLEVEEAATEFDGPVPEWWEDTVQETGIEYLLGIPCGSLSTLDWALREGIAPYQPFLVQFSPPTYHRDYFGEVDVDQEIGIVRVGPRIETDWTIERVVAEIWATKKQMAQQAEDLRVMQRHDIDRMFLSCIVYFASDQSTYDDMEMPRGVRTSLVTRRSSFDPTGPEMWLGATLASGEDDDGSWEKAMENLEADVAKRLPHLTPEFLRSLPKRFR